MTLPTQRVPSRDELISRQAAVSQLRVHPNTFDRIARRSKLARYRVLGDNQVFYLREQVDRIQSVEEVS